MGLCEPGGRPGRADRGSDGGGAQRRVARGQSAGARRKLMRLSMAKTRIAFNGFGRTGRQAFKAIYEYHPNLEVVGVAVRDVTQHEVIANLLAHDSNYGAFNGSVKSDGRNLLVNGKAIALSAAPSLSRLPWRDLGVDIVIECTGKFTKGSEAAGHLEAGAKKVIITAPAKNEDVTI